MREKCEEVNPSGVISMDLIRGVAQTPGDFFPSFVCTTITNRKASVSWDKLANDLLVEVDMENVPYRPTVTRPPGTNAVTPFSPVWPEAVFDAAYQVWLITMTPFRHRKFYYDCNTLDLLGHDGTVSSPPSDSLIVHMPVYA